MRALKVVATIVTLAVAYDVGRRYVAPHVGDVSGLRAAAAPRSPDPPTASPDDHTRTLDAALARGAQLRGGAAGLIIERSERTYRVTGGTEWEIAESLQAWTPRLGLERAFAYNRLGMQWRVESDSAGGCGPSNARVGVTAATMLPHWSGPTDAPAELRETWTRFEAGVRLHEQMHEDVTLAFAERLLRVGQEGALVGCAEAIRRLQAAEGELTARLDSLQERFDREAQEGTRPGGSWPPGR